MGSTLGEPDETTRVYPPRKPPPSTVRADATIFSNYDSPSYNSPYERPRSRRWPIVIALSLLAGIVLVVIGGMIAAFLIQGAGGVAVDLPDNNRLTVLTTPTPRQFSTPRSDATQTSPIQNDQPPTEIDRQQAESNKTMVDIATPTPKPVLPPNFTIVNQRFVVPAGQFVFYHVRYTRANTPAGNLLSNF